MSRQFHDQPKFRIRDCTPEYFSTKTISCHHSRKTSSTQPKENIGTFSIKRNNVLLHQRHQSLAKLTAENLALLGRINSQKAVIRFRKPQKKEKSNVIRIMDYLKNKENIDTKELDLLIRKKKRQIDLLTQRQPPKVFYF